MGAGSEVFEDDGVAGRTVTRDVAEETGFIDSAPM